MEAHSLVRSGGGLAIPRSRKLLAALGDERLVDHLRRGNEAAFEVLYDRHHAGVLSYCRHMLGSRDEAEDALQQAFISAHTDIVSSDKPIRFKAWIYTIARNRCLSMLRARREQPSDDIEHVSTVGLGEEVQQRADLKQLLADLHELPEEQRAALILSELGDLAHSEVAEVIGCEAAKVKSLVFQARSGLIERRSARETPCEEIREQLSTLRGGSLRRGPLRRHLKACPACADFREEVRRQRQMMALVLPVVPTLGLKESALAAVGIGGAAAGGGTVAGGGLGAMIAAKAGTAKVAVVAIAAGGAAMGGGAAVQKTVHSPSPPPPAAQPHMVAGAGTVGAGVLAAGTEDAAATENEDAASKAGVPGEDVSREARERDGRGRSEEARANQKDRGNGGEQRQGFTPQRGEPNGERARDFAAGRGNGEKRGLNNPKAGGGSDRAGRGGDRAGRKDTQRQSRSRGEQRRRERTEKRGAGSGGSGATPRPPQLRVPEPPRPREALPQPLRIPDEPRLLPGERAPAGVDRE